MSDMPERLYPHTYLLHSGPDAEVEYVRADLVNEMGLNLAKHSIAQNDLIDIANKTIRELAEALEAVMRATCHTSEHTVGLRHCVNSANQVAAQSLKDNEEQIRKARDA